MLKNDVSERSTFSSRQRFLSLTMGLAGTVSGSTTALANPPAPSFPTPPGHLGSSGWQTFGPASFHAASAAVHSNIFQGIQSHLQPAGTRAPLAVPPNIHARSSAANSTQLPTTNNLNLSSSKLNFLADNIANFSQLTIQVGNSREVVNLGTKLTAAEVVAAEQVLTGGSQTISINSSGVATGGSLTLNGSMLTALDHSLGGSIGALTIAHGVKVVDTLSLLSVGSLSNYGSILTASNSGGNTDTISAGTILNGAGGSIDSYASSGSLFSADPSLSAQTALTNSGTISSAGNLTLAAPAVYNLASHSSPAQISAAQNINVNTSGVQNSGTIQSTNGNISLSSTAALNVSGNGLVEAQKGNISITSVNDTLTLSGGTYQSQTLNLKSGTGDLTAEIGSASGLVNASGTNVMITSSDKGNLNLGAVDSNGDPLVAVTGNLIIDSSMTVTGGAPLTLIASGNITSGTQGTELDTSSTKGAGGDITLVAGADWSQTGNTVTISQSNANGNGSATGGSIDLTGGGSAYVTSINSSSTAGNAGSVNLIAFSGSTAGSGTITLAKSDGSEGVGIIASSSLYGAINGDINIIAGATSGTAITVGNSPNSTTMNYADALIGATVNVFASRPFIQNGSITFDATSGQPNNLTTQSFYGAGPLNNADINIYGNTFITGAFTSYTLGAFNNFAYQLTAVGPNPIGTATAGAAGQAVYISAGGNITLGNVYTFGGGGTGSGSLTPFASGGAGGNGGNVTLMSSAGFIYSAGSIDTSGGGGGGGAGGSQFAAATAGGAGGKAGTVIISAAKDITVVGEIVAMDGGAGGAGGAYNAATGVGGGGGGGGSAVGGGGGGGGGGVGTSGYTAGGGGGYGGFVISGDAANVKGGSGGGGTYGNATPTNASQTTGGGGGSNNGYVGYGTGNFHGYNPGGMAGGAGGDLIMSGGGAGATSLSSGGSGGVNSNGVGQGVAGGAAVANTGTINLTTGGTISAASGATTPLNIAAGSLNVTTTGSGNTQSAYLNNYSGASLSILATVGSSGIFSLTTAASPIVPAATSGAVAISSIRAGTVDITTGGTGSNDIAIEGPITSGTVINLTAGTGGAITNTAVLYSTAPTVNLMAAGGISMLLGDVTNLTAISTGGSVSLSQNTANTTLNLGTSSAGAGDTFSLSTASALNVSGGISTNGGNIQLSATGSNSSITLGAVLNAGATGSISLTAGAAIIDSAKVALTTNSLTLAPGTSAGTSSAPILTNAGQVVTNTGASGNVYVNDTNTGTVGLNAQTTSSGTLSVTTTAAQLNIVQLPFATVSITDTGTAGNVLINSGGSNTAVFGGSGTFTLSTNGNIDAAVNTQGVTGSTVTFTSQNGSIGSLRVVPVASATLVLNAASGGINVTDSIAATSVTGTSGAGSLFSLTDTASGGIGLTVAKAINAANISLTTTASAIQLDAAVGSSTTVTTTITSYGDLSATKAAVISGNTVALNSGTGSVGASGGPISTAVGTTLTLDAPLGSAYVSQTGNLSLGSQIIVSNSGSLVVTVAGNLTVTGNVTTGASILLTTTGSTSSLTTVGNLGNSAATVHLTSAGDIDNNGVITASGLIANASGAFNQNAGGDIIGNALTITAGGGVSLAGKFESAGANSSLQIGAGGTLTTSSASFLGTAAKPFSSVVISETGAASATIGGTVYATGAGAQGGLQLIGAKGALTVSGTLNDSTDSLQSAGIITVSGNVNDTALNIQTTSTGTIVVSGAIISGTTNLKSSSSLSIGMGATLSDTTDQLSGSTVAIDSTVTDTSLTIVSGGATTIGTGNAAANLTTTGQGSITAASISNSGTVSVGNLTLTSAAVANNGSVSTNILSIVNATGNLAVTGSGAFTSTAHGSLSLSAKGTINVGTLGSAVNPFNLSNVDAFSVTSGGIFTSPFTSISLSSDSLGNGGVVNIGASNLAFTTAPTAPLVLSAVSASGRGGSVTLDLTGTAATGLTIGSAAGNYSIDVHGKTSGGSITVTTPGALVVNTSALDFNATQAGYTGSGGNISFTGSKSVLINGILDTEFQNGNAGNITIISGAKTAFVIGGAAGTTNGLVGTGNVLVGSNIEISDAAGISIAAGNTVTATSGLKIDGTTLANSGTIATPALTIETATGNLTVTSGGTFTGQLTSFNAIADTGSVTVSGNIPAASNYTLSAVKGAVIFGTGATTLSAVSTDGAQDGGTITIDAKTLTISTAGLTLDASGKGGNAKGGTVSIDLTGTTNIVVGTGKSAITINAANTGVGSNGQVSIVTGGNLTVSGANLNLGSNTGSGSLALAGKILHITGSSFFNGLDLKSLNFSSNSSTAFALGGAAGVTNGIADAGLLLEAQQVTISNLGGAIYQGTAIGVEADSTTTPTVTILAKGDIGKITAPLTVNATTANSALNATSTAGNAYLNIVGGNEVLSASASKALTINSTLGTTAAAPLSAATITLNVASINAFTTSAKTIAATVTSGALNIADTQTALVTLNTLSSAGALTVESGGALTSASTITSTSSAISLMSGGVITTKGALTAATDISLESGGTSGSISVGAAINGGTSGNVSLTASGKGTITESKTGFIVSGGTVTLDAGGNIGTSHTAPFRISAGLLNLSDASTTASAFINNTFANADIGTVALGSTTAGKTFDYTGAITSGTATIDAPTVLISSSNLGASILTSATSLQIVATGSSSGNITVNDTNNGTTRLNALAAPGGNITVTASGALTTSGVITALGNVSLTAGVDSNLVIGNTVSSTSSTGSVTLQSQGLGSVGDLGSGSYKVTASSVLLITAGSGIGSSKVAFRTQAPSLALNTGGTTGDVFAANTNASSNGVDLLTASSVGSLTLSDTNTNTKNTAALDLASISAGSGAIKVTTNEQTLSLQAVSSLTTTNGNITLDNIYAANGTNLPQINLGADSTIHASTPSSNNLAAGNVFIAIGTVPTAATVKPGTTPSPAPNTSLSTTPNLITYGTTAYPNGSITTGNGDTLTSIQRNISFSTGKYAASTINLGTGVQITADPPAGASASASLPVKGDLPAISSDPASLTALPATSSSNSTSTGVTAAKVGDQTYNQVFSAAALSNSAVISSSQSNNKEADEKPRSTKRLFGSASNISYQKLQNGSLFLNPDVDTIIETPQGKVLVAAGSVVLLVCYGENVAVYDLHDNHQGAVKLLKDDQAITLTPGRSAVLTTMVKEEFENINPISSIAYRNLSSKIMQTGAKLFQADFEIMSMLKGLTPIKTMVNSKQKEKQKVAATLIKTAVILSQLSSCKEQYVYYVPEEKLALAP